MNHEGKILSQCKAVFVGATILTLLCTPWPALAVTVTPPGPASQPIPFTASGPATLSKAGIPVGCTTTFTGTIDGGGLVKITSATFSGSNLCKLIQASASSTSPWTAHIVSPTQLTIDNASVQVNVPLVGGSCGPSQITAQINETDGETLIGLDSVALSGGCSMSGSLTTSPYLHVTR